MAYPLRVFKILCVEDAPDIRLTIESTLSAYQVVFASTLKEATQLLSKESFPLILLDIGLPDGSGLELMTLAREKVDNASVIFLTGQRDLATKLAAFSLGADDFILKPFDPLELKIRVDAKIKKIMRTVDRSDIIRIGSLICNLQEQRLYMNEGGMPLELTSLEFKIFHLLARTPNKIFTRAEILERAWGSAIAVSDRVVDVHVSNLRRKLSKTDVTIETMIGSGYKVTVLKTSSPEVI